MIAIALSSAERAAASTHRLLAFLRRQPLSLRRLDVTAAVAGIEDLFRRIAVHLDRHAGLVVLASDARIDLLLTDVRLRGDISGPARADEARRSRPGIKVLFLTGCADDADAGHGGTQVGVVLAKPFALATLAARVQGPFADRRRRGSSDGASTSGLRHGS